MAHSILEYAGRHETFRDADLRHALSLVRMDDDPRIAFIGSFLDGEMAHVSGGLDPDLDAHLPDDEARIALRDRVLRLERDHASDRQTCQTLRRLADLIS